jgi:hypothetical protein
MIQHQTVLLKPHEIRAVALRVDRGVLHLSSAFKRLPEHDPAAQAIVKAILDIELIRAGLLERLL